jgi:hypothetical protein
MGMKTSPLCSPISHFRRGSQELTSMMHEDFHEIFLEESKGMKRVAGKELET